MQNLLIFPFSSTGIETLDCLGNEWNCIGFISDDKTLVGTTYSGIRIFDRSAFSLYNDVKVLAAQGSPSSFKKRSRITQNLGLKPDRFATVIHPRASVSSYATVGFNVLLMAGVVVTANANIGNHVVILPNSVIHHDSKIGDHTLIAANVTIAGRVFVGNSCYLGAASSIKNGITIGNNCLIGMAANVTKSFGPNVVLIGNPAREVDPNKIK